MRRMTAHIQVGALSGIRLIVGLGNPGRDYEHTRHNLGFLTVQRLAEKLKFKFQLSSLTNGLTAEGTCGDRTLCLLLPMTKMNNSGSAVHQVMGKKELSPEDVLVICDDFHLDYLKLRLRARGSDGGHNGLKSVIQQLGTDHFARLRMGIGRPADKNKIIDYVLDEFTKAERAHLDAFIERAVSCCLMWLEDGISGAVDQYNAKK